MRLLAAVAESPVTPPHGVQDGAAGGVFDATVVSVGAATATSSGGGGADSSFGSSSALLAVLLPMHGHLLHSAPKLDYQNVVSSLTTSSNLNYQVRVLSLVSLSLFI